MSPKLTLDHESVRKIRPLLHRLFIKAGQYLKTASLHNYKVSPNKFLRPNSFQRICFLTAFQLDFQDSILRFNKFSA